LVAGGSVVTRTKIVWCSGETAIVRDVVLAPMGYHKRQL
jgi:hypothetical protein